MLNNHKTIDKVGKSTLRRVVSYLIGLILLWIFIFFIIFPLERGYDLPPEHMDLIEGTRAYVNLVRDVRPDLFTVLLGLSKSGVEYQEFQAPHGVDLSFGNISMSFLNNGQFHGVKMISK